MKSKWIVFYLMNSDKVTGERLKNQVCSSYRKERTEADGMKRLIIATATLLHLLFLFTNNVT